jgi:hypothetical protein
MNVATVLGIIALIVKEEPAVEQALRNIFAKKDPTPADWDAEKAAWAEKYEELVPDTKLPQS